MIIKELSEKIRTLSLLCTIMVAYRHAQTHEAFWDGWANATPLYQSIASGLTNFTGIAVPFFFLVSGYFFLWRSYYKPTEFSRLISKKFRTLLAPFLFWNIIFIPILWVGGKVALHENWMDYVEDLLMSRFNGPLWYVRNLMLMMAVVPLYNWIFLLCSSSKDTLRWFGYISLIAVLSYIYVIWWPMDTMWWSTEGWLFFFLGGAIRNNEKLLEYKLPQKVSIVLFVLWVVSCFTLQLTYWINKIHIFIGIIALWNVMNVRYPLWIKNMAKYSFFIYVTHFIVLKIIKTIIAHWFYGNEIAAIATYLLAPMVVVPLLYKCGKVWNKVSPKVFGVVTGGRGG